MKSRFLQTGKNSELPIGCCCSQTTRLHTQFSRLYVTNSVSILVRLRHFPFVGQCMVLNKCHLLVSYFLKLVGLFEVINTL